MSKCVITDLNNDLEDIYRRVDSSVPPEKLEVLKNMVRHLVKEDPQGEKPFNKAMNRLRKQFNLVPKKSHLIHAYNVLVHAGEIEPAPNGPAFRQWLTRKVGKSNSGVLVITVLTSPYPQVGNNKPQRFTCEWDCFYCPNEPGQPRSYLHDEPAVLRANRNKFDPILQFHDRAATLAMNGHPVDKIELLVLGGTWSSYPHQYQEEFIRDLFFAANTFQTRSFEGDGGRTRLSLAEEQKINETALTKIIGITLETRPDCIDAQELLRFRRYGCTRVQIGIQHTDDEVLKIVNRGHTRQQAVDAVKRLLDCGYKVDGHFMPDLPGSNPEKDKDMFRYVLTSPDLRVDQMKIYPHSVVPWTKTKKWLDSGRFKPYSDVELRDVLVWFKQRVHPWIRLNRVVRDIPGHYISGGNSNTNLRQEILAEMRRQGKHQCRCIRCREVRNDQHQLDEIDLVVRKYKAADGIEYFISYETPDRKTICGFCRLRITKSAGWIEPPTTKNLRQRAKKLAGDSEEVPEKYLLTDSQGRQLVFPELEDAALVRELHV
eukprot:INCI8944.1.p1 GENE.INCI8944.1~~INCI8944.1.p1  ORF type:complete len:543 (-),score=80.84 INCI8944.1:1776-3404(-)